MSVIGIDFGNESCYVAVARAGGIETVDNDYSLRATPSTVAFGEKQRVLGVAAKNQLVTNIKNTVYGFKRYIGRTFEDPVVQEDVPKVPFTIIKHKETNGVAVQVKYLGEDSVFTVEQITAMLLTKLKETTEVAIRAKISDCVISVPSYYTDFERRALLSAAQMAGLNVLRILNETSATALTYGIYKQDLPNPDEKPRNVVFVDCGHSALQVSACAFNKGKLKMLASSADSNLGGRDFDKVLADYFCKDFRQRYNIDPEKNHRAYVRLLTEVEKLKKQMSANATKLPLNIECFMDDKDVTSSIVRGDFETMSSTLFQRVEITLHKCLADSKLQMDEIHSVEIVGGSSRIPAIKQLIEKVFGKIPSTTLNQDEAVARGCALQCAILSPAYKVRDFSITDVQPYPIRLVWDESSTDGFTEVFPQYHPIPFSRMISFHRKDGLVLQASYNAPTPFPNPHIGTFIVSDIKPTGDAESVKLKVKVRINMNGVFSVCSATAYEKLPLELDPMETEQQVTEPSPESSQVNSSQESAGSGDSVPNDVAMSQDDPANAENGEKKEAKKIHCKTIELQINSITGGLTQRDIDLMTEKEGKMVAEDRREKERIDAKNALEEYVYHFREKIESDYAKYMQEGDRAQITSHLNQLENWLYEEGSDETRHVYSDKLEQLRKSAEPIQHRVEEASQRPAVIREFEISIQLGRKVVDMCSAKEPRYSHLEDTDLDKLTVAIIEAEIWLSEARNVLKNLKDHDAVPGHLKCSDLIQRRKSFESIVQPIINKPKPKVEPPKVEPSQAEEQMNNAEIVDDNIPNSGTNEEGQKMEVD